jgi:hypothetical protein
VGIFNPTTVLNSSAEIVFSFDGSVLSIRCCAKTVAMSAEESSSSYAALPETKGVPVPRLQLAAVAQAATLFSVYNSATRGALGPGFYH